MGNQIIAEFAEALKNSTYNTTLCSNGPDKKPGMVDIKNFPGVARAWVVFDGTQVPLDERCTIHSSENIHSVTYKGTGIYTIVFSTSSIFTSDYYIVNGSILSCNLSGANTFLTAPVIANSRRVPLLSAISLTSYLTGTKADGERIGLTFFNT